MNFWFEFKSDLSQDHHIGLSLLISKRNGAKL